MDSDSPCWAVPPTHILLSFQSLCEEDCSPHFVSKETGCREAVTCPRALSL